MFDSLYSSLDLATLDLLMQLFGADVKVKMEKYLKQVGGRDCGVFAIAICTSLANSSHPGYTCFNQDAMRPHLHDYFESFHLTPFPSK